MHRDLQKIYAMLACCVVFFIGGKLIEWAFADHPLLYPALIALLVSCIGLWVSILLKILKGESDDAHGSKKNRE